MAAKSRRLVIDADVLRASGGPNAVHPTATKCREYLQGVLRICHRAQVSDQLNTEWYTHASKFARDWKTAMAQRGKLERVEDVEDVEVRRKLPGAELTDEEQAALDKDLHLLEAALRADRVVVSLDARMKRIANKASKVARKLRGLRFVDPTAESVESL